MLQTNHKYNFIHLGHIMSGGRKVSDRHLKTETNTTKICMVDTTRSKWENFIIIWLI